KKHRGAIKLYIKPFLKAYQKEKMPRLKLWPFVKISTNDHMWNAMLQSGGLSLLDLQLIQEVSRFYDLIEKMKQLSTHFNRMTNKYLLPSYNADISTFYNTKTKKIRPQYRWYIHFLKFYRN